MKEILIKTIPLDISNKQDILVERILSMQFERNPELKQKYDKRQTEHCKQDIAYNLSYLAQAIELQSQTIYNEYMLWLKNLLIRLGISQNDLVQSFECLSDVLEQELGKEAAIITSQYIGEGIKILKSPVNEFSSFIEPTNPQYTMAKQFLELILSGNRYAATSMILKLAEEGCNIKDIYLNILQQVQREIGLLWQTGKISVAQEHYCTSITQLAISQLYPYIFNKAHHGKSMVATCVSGELHELGIRMLSDIFELEGWDTWYLGANMPGKDVLETIKEKNPDLIAISATMSFHLSRVTALINSIHEAGIKTPIIVGGYPFILDAELWKKVNANASAKDALEALQVADRLVVNR